MSALAGVWNFDKRPDSAAQGARMLAAQAIYGPHDSAQWNAGDIALGRALYDILPEDRFDAQPVVGGHGRYVLVADIRLDNRDELIGTLRIPAESARAMADSAILMAAWERWTESVFDHLVGDYAFALWDTAERCLLLARDPFGHRPLHYHRGKSFFAFSTMAKGLHALPEIPSAPDEERATEIFALVPEHGSRSFFLGIERIVPGHVITITADGVAERRFWNPQHKPIRLASAGEYAEALRHHLDVAVQAQLRGADGRVGSHLSAGFDSSAVAATAARLIGASGGKVIAFTSVPRQGYAGSEMRGRFADEGPLAAMTARMYPNMEHVLIRSGGRSPLDNLDRNFFLFERPIINICNQVWYDALNTEARSRKLTVMLWALLGNLTISNDGLSLLPELIAQGRLLRWFGETRALVRRRHRSWPAAVAAGFGPWVPEGLWKRLRKLGGRGTLDVGHYATVNPQRLAELNLGARAAEGGMDLAIRPRSDGHAMRLWAMARSDFGNYHKGFLGGWGIDYRDPTADQRLVEFSLNVPSEQFLSDGVPRALARRAFAGLLPKEVLDERRRGLQAADWYEGLAGARDGIRAELDRLEQTGIAAKSLDIERMRRLVDDWPQSGWTSEEVYIPYRLALLRGISVGHFLRKAAGGNL